MPMYEINRQERGVRYASYRVFADTQEDALERIFEEDIPPTDEYFDQHDADTDSRELPDCTCGICVAQGFPWACLEAEPEDEVLDLGMRERAWDDE